MKPQTALLFTLLVMPAAFAAEEPPIKEERASAWLVLTRPGENGAFADPLASLRREANDSRPFKWEEVDEKIDEWFDEAVTRFPNDHKKHEAKWNDLREQSKRDARATLAPVEEAWKASVEKAAVAFEKSEAGFYARRPAILIRGTYRYREGRRDRSTVDPAWEFEPATLANDARIEGRDRHDSGEIILKAAELGHPMFTLRAEWEFSLEAGIKQDSLTARPVGKINTPEISAYVSAIFEGDSNREVTLHWNKLDKSTTRIGLAKLTIGDMKYSTSFSLGTGFIYDALDENAARPAIIAGKEEAP